ncbi:hypothetical protein D9O40_00920 [Clostridium autoethanogenum]|uniref:Uncharacterized protein n=1 Tax=Clostridium autoethanogenum TaxID=84023 RepID=A0A3M0T2T3_9CLOT|nr:hypothetical protein [Clostridium autoethanogenum]RMD04943.1 hypothetical protein D9O40_00920 [Clostridium autoethanogenum]
MDKETLSAIKQLLKDELSPIKSQLNENTEILRALEHSAEIHKADTDNLTHQIAQLQGTVKNLSGEMSQKFSDLNETNKSLLEMYGAHEAEIRTLRRKPV